jgi:hypothetical protein
MRKTRSATDVRDDSHNGGEVATGVNVATNPNVNPKASATSNPDLATLCETLAPLYTLSLERAYSIIAAENNGLYGVIFGACCCNCTVSEPTQLASGALFQLHRSRSYHVREEAATARARLGPSAKEAVDMALETLRG